MNKTCHFMLTASIVLAVTLTLSCSSDGGGGNEQSGNGLVGGNDSSSSALTVSSSDGGLSSSVDDNTHNNSSSSIEGSSSSDGDNKGGVSSSSLATAVSSSSVSDCSNDNTETHFCDTRDGRLYKYVQIGEQVWMAENLDYDVEGSKCYGEEGEVITDWDKNYNPYMPVTTTLSATEVQANCVKYGRLYDWAMVMTLPSSCNSNDCSSQMQSPRKGICPSGWHIPSNSEWDELLRFVYDDTDGIHEADCLVDTTTITGRHLKAINDWNNDEYNEDGTGLDTYDFNALPGGVGSSDGSFSNVGDGGFWWCATEASEEGYVDSSDRAVSRIMYSRNQGCFAYRRTSIKSGLRSVRCLKD